MLDTLKKEVASERGEFWKTVREILKHLQSGLG
jgi:hypothetical protein